MSELKKGSSIKIRQSVIVVESDFDKFLEWIKTCYNAIKKETNVKKSRNKIGIDFEIYEIEGKK